MISNDLSIKLYQAIKEADVRHSYEHWHASSLADCPRAHYFKRLGVKPINEPSSALRLRWLGGHALEEAIRPHVASIFGDIVSNQRLTSDELDLTGEYDNYAEDSGTIIEIKTVHDYSFKEQDGVLGLKDQIGHHKNGNKMWAIKTTPHLHHEIQNHGYKLLLEEQGKEVNAIVYIYISLSGRIVVYVTEPKDEITRQVKERLKVLNEAWTKTEPPVCICKPEHPLYDSVMQYCPYKGDDGCCSLKLITKGENSE